MTNRISRRRRLFVLLAGLFGFLTPTAVAVAPDTAIPEVVSTSTAAAADSIGVQDPGTCISAPNRGGNRKTAASQSCGRDVSHRAAFSAAAVPNDGPDHGPARHVAWVVTLSAGLPATAVAADTKVRGPPSITGSDVLNR